MPLSVTNFCLDFILLRLVCFFLSYFTKYHRRHRRLFAGLMGDVVYSLGKDLPKDPQGKSKVFSCWYVQSKRDMVRILPPPSSPSLPCFTLYTQYTQTRTDTDTRTQSSPVTV